ncbi:MAG: tRNA (adenosine(37)-N6)-threonylcarbamoyltransferase complex transferase subunit TsaD [Candidatus Marinimicrobia bacterium]|nr:tRNA (adenosine(37)-N6)-threonylcarbamoyltransferase complex transferase subunit TsaD [Candidatus Neomarinimicrobiota bacterium]
MIVLGIETSCDETSAAVVRDGMLLSNVTNTQVIHSQYGGVVPEIASRSHEENIQTIVESALSASKYSLMDIDAIAVTYGPGLFGTLLVGLNYAKGLSIGLDIPFIGVNHMEGHLFANLLDNPEFSYPFLCMLVSGGHTQIWEVQQYGSYHRIANTRDDAAGEAFDKGARIMGLRYPGGPEIEKNAMGGNPKAFPFTIPRVRGSELDFSFSGLKTAILYTCKKMTESEIQSNLNDLCASYQEVIVDTLIDRIHKAVEITGIRRFSVAGGVAANKRFREKVDKIVKPRSIEVSFPRMEYCTDNAAMIAIAGYERILNGETSSLNLKAIPNLSLDEVHSV